MKKCFLSTDHPSMPWWVGALSLCFCIPGGMSPGEGAGGRLPGTDSLGPARLQILLLLLACASRHTCDDYTMTIAYPCRIVCICRHLLMSKLQKPDVLGTRFPRRTDGPHSTTSRSATNRFVFFLPLPCASSFFLRCGQDSGTCQTLIDVAS
jgi:hypothetical protein